MTLADFLTNYGDNLFSVVLLVFAVWWFQKRDKVNSNEIKELREEISEIHKEDKEKLFNALERSNDALKRSTDAIEKLTNLLISKF